jgi:ribonucleotide reductase beta subunit family protein with ferritin-like domain
METIGLNKKTNFFEARPTEYQSAYNSNSSYELKVLDDF